MSASTDELTTPGLVALRQERAARKAADRTAKELRNELRILRNERDALHAALTRIANMTDEENTK